MTRLLTTLSVAVALAVGLNATAQAQAGVQTTSTWSYYPTNVCITPATSCSMPAVVPGGTPCWCATPWGPVNGRAG